MNVMSREEKQSVNVFVINKPESNPVVYYIY